MYHTANVIDTQKSRPATQPMIHHLASSQSGMIEVISVDGKNTVISIQEFYRKLFFPPTPPSQQSTTEPRGDDSSMDLLSQENLDRSSPELWPEQIPGVSKFASLSMSHSADKPDQQPEWLKDLDHEDISVLQGFGSLTAAALLEKVRDLQNLAYQLGLEEAKEMTRGRFLGILPKKKDIRR